MAGKQPAQHANKHTPSKPLAVPAPANAPAFAASTATSAGSSGSSSSAAPRVPPTPQNTPVVPAPIRAAVSSSSTAAGTAPASTSTSSPRAMGKNKGGKAGAKAAHRHDDDNEDEDDTLDEANMQQLLQRNPDLAAAIQSKLSELTGLGPALALAPEVKRRLKALKNLHGTHAQLEAEFRQELLALERKFHEKYEPLYAKRAKIVAGEVEPTDAECEREDSDIEEVLQAATIQEVDDNEKPLNPPSKGIPNFWLTALRNHPMVAELITEADEPALSQLVDVTLSYTADNLGFTLGFVFAENEFFTNKVLTKSYYMQNNVGAEYDDLIYSSSEGCTIDWKPNKNLTVKVETKKQRHKGSKKVRVVKREVPTPSFFRFFSPPKMPSRAEGQEQQDDDEDEVDPEVEESLEQDFEIGEVIKSRIIQHAVDWFTGKALENYDEQYDDDYDDEGMHDEDDDGGEDDDEDDEDDGPAPAANPSATKRAAQPGDKAECQQQ